MIYNVYLFQFGPNNSSDTIFFGHIIVCNNTQETLRFGQVWCTSLKHGFTDSVEGESSVKWNLMWFDRYQDIWNSHISGQRMSPSTMHRQTAVWTLLASLCVFRWIQMKILLFSQITWPPTAGVQAARIGWEVTVYLLLLFTCSWNLKHFWLLTLLYFKWNV